MRGAFKLLTVRGIGIYIHWSFFLLVVWLLFINGIKGGSGQQFAWSVIFIFSIFACVILHELGHALVAKRYGIGTKSIILLPIGGIANIERFPDNPRQELAIAVAGPLVNVIIAALLVPFLLPYQPFWQYQETTLFVNSSNFLYNLHVINILLVLFNLIPAFPMDGGRILRALLGLRMDYLKATDIAANIGKVIAVLFIIGGIFLFNIFLSIIGVFIIFAATSERNFLRLRALVKGVKLKEVVMPQYDSLPLHITAQEAATMLIDKNSDYFVVMDNGEPVGTVGRKEIMRAMAEQQYSRPVRDLLTPKPVYLDEEKEVDKVLEKLSENNERIFPVMKDNHIIGVVNLKHIIEYLLVTRKAGLPVQPHLFG